MTRISTTKVKPCSKPIAGKASSTSSSQLKMSLSNLIMTASRPWKPSTTSALIRFRSTMIDGKGRTMGSGKIDESPKLSSSSARRSSKSDWDDFDAWETPSLSSTKQDGGANRDDFDPPSAGRGAIPNKFQKSGSYKSGGNGLDRSKSNRNPGGGRKERRGSDWRELEQRRENGDRIDGDDYKRSFRGASNKKTRDPDEIKINMRALEGAGFVHLYGLASCVNALQANRRDFTRPEDLINLEALEGEDLEMELKQRARKPEAQYSPWLFVQDQTTSKRTGDKARAAELLLELAKERRIPTATVDKGVLNTLSGNRPHQGFVLRCGKLDFDPITSLRLSDKKLWLCLDEIVDPQNLGALVRSVFFLSTDDIGIVVCAKNSAPPSPVVSAASAGALELAQIYETSNLPKLLLNARQDGYRVIGAASSVPTTGESSQQVCNLSEFKTSEEPTVLVLGSEGHGLRSLVAKACTEFVSIPGGKNTGVDSLNVSVTGGILLWHILHSMKTSN